MNKAKFAVLSVAMTISVALSTGCSSKKMMLEFYFDAIQISKSDSTDVLNMLPDKGKLQTSNSVSVLDMKGSNRELGIVVFKEDNAEVLRTDYLQKKQNFTHVKLYVVVKTEVADDLLNQPFETNAKKHLAILRYCHEKVIEDAQPFLEDQETESLTGLARTALSTGFIHLKNNPRQDADLLSNDGFKFEHPTLDQCWMWLKQDTENTYTVTIRTSSLLDPLMKW